MRLARGVSGLGTYPFVRLEEAKRRAVERGLTLLDFGVGEPREPIPSLLRQALVDGIGETSTYPRAEGLPELRRAIAGWCRRRFGIELDPDREVIPTYGSKEAIFSLAQVLLERGGDRNVIVVTEPGYPVPARGAIVAGGEPLTLELREANGFLPDLESLDDETWRRVALLWLNYPNNPTGATAPLAFLEHASQLARQHGFVVAADEAYTELWFDAPPPSALEAGSLENVVVFNTLSKRSSVPGFRSGFAAGDPDLIGAMRAFRPNSGTAPQEFVQRASVVAWEDETHVEEARERYRRKRDLFLDLFARTGLRVAASQATMYLWVAVPDDEGAAEGFAERLLEHGVVVAPGTFFGAAGNGYVRFALVPSLEDCARAVETLDRVL